TGCRRKTPQLMLLANLRSTLTSHFGTHADTALRFHLNLWPAQPEHIAYSTLPQRKISPDRSNWQIRPAPWPTMAMPYAKNNPEFSRKMRVRQNFQSRVPVRETIAEKIHRQKIQSVKSQK